MTGGTGGSFSRLLLESDVLGREVLGVGIPDGSASTGGLLGKYDSAFLVDASVDRSCKLILFCLFAIIQVEAGDKLTSPVSQASRA